MNLMDEKQNVSSHNVGVLKYFYFIRFSRSNFIIYVFFMATISLETWVVVCHMYNRVKEIEKQRKSRIIKFIRFGWNENLYGRLLVVQ